MEVKEEPAFNAMRLRLTPASLRLWSCSEVHERHL